MRGILGAAIAVGMFVSQTAGAFTLIAGSTAEGWGSETLTFEVNPSGCPIDESELNAMIDRALDAWNQSPTGSIKLVRGPRVDIVADDIERRAQAGVANAPLILCDPNMSASIGADANFIPAATSVLTSQVNRRSQISHAYILINTEEGKRANLQNLADETEKFTLILSHEIGHVLGLGHTSNENALMFFDVTDKETLALAQDDIDGLTYLYPRKEPGDGVFACATLDSGSGGGSNPPGPGPFLAILGFCALGTWIFKPRAYKDYLRIYL